MDYLLPFSEITSWSILSRATAPKSVPAPTNASEVLHVSIPGPPPNSSYLKRWLWPDLRSVTIWINAESGALEVAEMELTGDRIRSVRVAKSEPFEGATVPVDSTVTDITGAATRIEITAGHVKGFGVNYFTRHRLETESF